MAGPDYGGGFERHASAARVSTAQVKMSLSLWGGNFVAFTLANLLSGSHRIAQAGAVRLATFVFGLALCYGMHRLLRHLRKRGFRTRAIVLGIVALAAAETHAWVTFFAFSWLNNAKLAFTIGNWNEAILSLAMWTWFFVAWAGLYMGIEYSTEVKEEERRSAELRELANAAKLRALHNQINPHFLFNALNSVSTLILDERGPDAETLLVRLSAIFRRTLATDPTTDIQLRDELQLQLEYLEIERTRYPDLAVIVDIPDELLGAAIPALLLQPLIENAIKHGVACSKEPAHILIVARGKQRCARRDDREQLAFWSEAGRHPGRRDWSEERPRASRRKVRRPSIVHGRREQRWYVPRNVLATAGVARVIDQAGRSSRKLRPSTRQRFASSATRDGRPTHITPAAGLADRVTTSARTVIRAKPTNG